VVSKLCKIVIAKLNTYNKIYCYNVLLSKIRYIVKLCQRSLVDLGEESSTWDMKTIPPYGSSEEY